MVMITMNADDIPNSLYVEIGMGSTVETPRDPIRVVLVEDHELVREGFKRILSLDDEIDVVGEASGATEAISLISEAQPDVILLDIRLSQGSGIEVAKAAPALAPSSKVLVLSAYDDAYYVHSLIEAGVAGYLLKTASAGELKRAVHDAAAARLVFAPEVAQQVVSVVRNGSWPLSDAPRVIRSLSPREAEVFARMRTGLRNSGIAKEMDIALKTVETHVAHILMKLGARTRTQAVLRGHQYN